MIGDRVLSKGEAKGDSAIGGESMGQTGASRFEFSVTLVGLGISLDMSRSPSLD